MIVGTKVAGQCSKLALLLSTELVLLEDKILKPGFYKDPFDLL